MTFPTSTRVSPAEHLTRIAEGRFPEDTRAWLQDAVNFCVRIQADLPVSRVGRHQRDEILRELWLMEPEDSDLAKANALLSRFRRSTGTKVAGNPRARLISQLRALDAAGYKVPNSPRQVIRICRLVVE